MASSPSGWCSTPSASVPGPPPVRRRSGTAGCCLVGDVVGVLVAARAGRSAERPVEGELSRSGGSGGGFRLGGRRRRAAAYSASSRAPASAACFTLETKVRELAGAQARWSRTTPRRDLRPRCRRQGDRGPEQFRGPFAGGCSEEYAGGRLGASGSRRAASLNDTARHAAPAPAAPAATGSSASGGCRAARRSPGTSPFHGGSEPSPRGSSTTNWLARSHACSRVAMGHLMGRARSSSQHSPGPRGTSCPGRSRARCGARDSSMRSHWPAPARPPCRRQGREPCW